MQSNCFVLPTHVLKDCFFETVLFASFCGTKLSYSQVFVCIRILFDEIYWSKILIGFLNKIHRNSSDESLYCHAAIDGCAISNELIYIRFVYSHAKRCGMIWYSFDGRHRHALNIILVCVRIIPKFRIPFDWIFISFCRKKNEFHLIEPHIVRTESSTLFIFHSPFYYRLAFTLTLNTKNIDMFNPMLIDFDCYHYLDAKTFMNHECARIRFCCYVSRWVCVVWLMIKRERLKMLRHNTHSHTWIGGRRQGRPRPDNYSAR